jgi:hypothetical protein
MSQANLSSAVPVGIPAPSGLSQWACAVWTELTQRHNFEAHELIVFERALQWWDRSDAAATAGNSKLAIDAGTAALRHWRLLKFLGREEARRAGRPSGDNWNAARRAAAGR